MKGKKRLIGIIIALAIALGYFVIPPMIEEAIKGPYTEDVGYYGCPNSKRVKRLNIVKKKVF